MPTQIIAVDWSGAEKAKIGIAEAIGPDELVMLETESDRKLVIEHIIEKSAQAGESLIVGLDFAFSFPDWFFKEHHLTSASDLWVRVEQEGEKWLTSCQPPFWGLKGSKRPNDRELYRVTERELFPRAHPKSVFQIYNPGAVGRSSIRGMPYLLRLKREGFSIWPFDVPSKRLVVEIYPRLFTGRTVKSKPEEREKFLKQYPRLSMDHRQMAIKSEDAFDAAVSALEMTRYLSEFDGLKKAMDRQTLLEGTIWYPHENKNTPN